MKIRIKGNSLRYRLSMPEVERFSKEGYIEEAVDFPGTQLIYALKRVNEGEGLDAGFKDNKITLTMPDEQANEWTGTDRIGFENRNGPIYLLVEKDFKCLDNITEDQSDNYPNPNSVC